MGILGPYLKKNKVSATTGGKPVKDQTFTYTLFFGEEESVSLGQAKGIFSLGKENTPWGQP